MVMADEFEAMRAPVLGEVRYVLLRTMVDPDTGEYDARFAEYDLHPLPPDTTEDSALQTALVLADEDETWSVWVGRWECVDGVDGKRAAAASIAIGAATKK